MIEAYFNDGQGDPRADAVEMAPQLRWILAARCTVAVATILRRKRTTNGFESWGQVVRMYKLPTKARAIGRRSKMLKPSSWVNRFELFGSPSRRRST